MDAVLTNSGGASRAFGKFQHISFFFFSSTLKRNDEILNIKFPKTQYKFENYHDNFLLFVWFG